MQWTDEQRSAIEARGENVLLAAAAGSGKTTVLVERVVRQIMEGVDIDAMLIVTFTRAAAADMRMKLIRQLNAQAESGNGRAVEQVERLPNASIMTLHAFCTDVLHAHFEAADVDPHFRIMDDTEAEEITLRAQTAALEAAYQSEDPAFQAALSTLEVGFGTDAIGDMAIQLLNFLRNRPDPSAWLAAALERGEGEGTIWFETLRHSAQRLLDDARALNAYAQEIAAQSAGLAHYARALAADAAALEALPTDRYDALRDALDAFTPTRLGRKPAPKGTALPSDAAPQEEAQLAEIKALRDRVKRTIQRARDTLAFAPEAALEDVHANQAALRVLATIAQAIEARCEIEKAERAALTFSDLEHKTLRALNDPATASALRARFRWIYLDEYQDTSDVQAAIIDRLRGDHNLFMVGDVKQSIYRFRQAEPRLFIDTYDRFRQGNGGQVIALTRNFRSRARILTFINAVFPPIMNGGDAEILYDDAQALRPGATYEGDDPPIEFLLIEKPKAADATAEEAAEDDASPSSADAFADELSDAEREGLWIADRIRSLRAEQPGLRFRDIAILTRARKSVLAPMAATLAAAGIPAYADAAECAFDTLEVALIMALLALIVNHRQDIELISVLRSPLVGLSTSQLSALRIQSPTGSFYDAAMAYAEHPPQGDLTPEANEGYDPAATAQTLRTFFAQLSDWRLLARCQSVPLLLQTLYHDTGFYAYAGALPGGRQRQANLATLVARARAYEAHMGGDLPGFLAYARAMKARGDGDAAHTLGENDDVVRLMTVHKSKGLEFPVVFAAMLGRHTPAARTTSPLSLHKNLGIGLLRADTVLETRRDTLARAAIQETLTVEMQAEELRILYVALTRARERLILVGSVRNALRSYGDFCRAVRHPSLAAPHLTQVAAAAQSMPGGAWLNPLQSGTPLPDAAVHVRWIRATPPPVNEPRPATDSPSASMPFDPSLPIDESLRERLTWVYPYADCVYAPLKLTVTGVTREIEGPITIPEPIPTPLFMTNDHASAPERGSSIHRALQSMDYSAFADRQGADLRAAIEAQLARMVERGLLSPLQRESVSSTQLARFWEGPIGRRIRAATICQREWRFNLVVPVREVVPDSASEADVIVQGSIDLCFIEDDHWVLIDYKTDRTDDPSALAAHYRPQLQLYARALRVITHIPVGEARLCLLRDGQSIVVDVSVPPPSPA